MHMAQEHAQWNMVLGVPCEFHILNPIGDPSVEGQGYVMTDATNGPAEPQLAMLLDFLLRNGPRGVTPLTKRLQDIRRRIEPQRQELMRQGQRIVLIVATDGMPTTQWSGQSSTQDKRDLTQALRGLSAIDVHLVLRLCTGEQDTVDYYGEVDREIELNLEVVDDLSAEARELNRVGNQLLTYTPLLHRIREGGTFFKVLDVLDERTLTPGEIYLLSQMLLRRSADDGALPREPNDFCTEVERRLQEATNSGNTYFEPLRRRLAPPMDPSCLRYAMGLTGVTAALKWLDTALWGVCKPPDWIPLPRYSVR